MSTVIILRELSDPKTLLIQYTTHTKGGGGWSENARSNRRQLSEFFTTRVPLRDRLLLLELEKKKIKK